MSDFTDADTIRILVATDNHVGYEERDPIRKDDSWRTFDEIMNLARTEDVDMVLLAGDLFHDNKPSRKSMYQVMRTLRQNCLGMKPCELEFLSDANEVFEGAFPHVNYEDPDINISIPVFSIHGNHDDPSGDGHYCSLDLLQVAGLVNYFGRIAEADNIEAKPLLLQKGQTKLALYGLSNVRDERMFRTFRDNKVKWFRPDLQQGDWFSILALHQNHHAHTATSYLPENVLPDFMDLVVWGHEHECLIDPSRNPETGFHVMQPGSSVATSLVPGEAVPKHVAVVNVTGRDFQIKKIPLKTVRPFVTKEIVLATDKRFKGVDRIKDNRQELTKRLMKVVDEMIDQANAEWLAIQDDDEDDNMEERPLPLIRLKVEYTAPEGGQYDCENPQRFSNRFVGKVANTNDVVYFHRRKTAQRSSDKDAPDLPEGIESLSLDTIKVEALVQEFLAAQSLKILPQAPFGDAVNQFVNKDDKHAMEMFVSDSLASQVKQMLDLDSDDDDLEAAMEKYRDSLEKKFSAGLIKPSGQQIKVKPKPDYWDSDLDGHWEDQPGVVEVEVEVETAPPEDRPRRSGFDDGASEMMGVQDEVVDAPPARKAPTKRGAAATGRRTTATATAKAAPAKKTVVGKKVPAKKAGPARGRGKKQPFLDEDEDEDEEEEDVVMDDDPFMDDDGPPPRAAATRSKRSQPTRAAAAAAAPKTRQTRLNFASQAASQKAVEISDDEISDDDPFEPATATKSRRR
ncbi:DNA repair exonuclease [Sodiomyces alkalinus F11]|uniref:Double-strand break repair protein n=1 Tax=Sodiomyces alkalinus (strain CBS 110278 / VKM F-3762 / F11) TaxID=1314773 RepID=A0A3N2PL69_SODAK|nr:DNA repair exonuclease [Sodiomyces alkalinus F11]ROT35076.1 DNA repair exonuclease [Sodiomyces alkalinus F11]